MIGTDAFQECDTVGITMPVTKHNWLITDANDVPRVIREAFHVATTGRPGPVLVDMPKDVSNQMMDWYWPDSVDLPGYKPNTKGHPKQIKDAARLMGEAQRPVIYAGGGILKARAAEALRALVDLTGFPVVTTLMARGSFPDDHELCLGMPGMHGNYTAVTSMQKADLLIALGSRFDDRVTGKVGAFAPDAKIIHVDIDPAELGKVRRPDVPIVGDCRLVIEEMVKAVKADQNKREWPSLDVWHKQLREWQDRYPLRYEQLEDGPLKPQFCIDMLRENTPDDTIVVSGVGQHQMWTSQRWKFNHPYTFVNSGGLGTMGFAVPAAIGAKVGKPERMVWAVDGDGCFQMTAQELVTASAERIPVKVAILNNAYLGHGAPVAGALLRGALQRGVPVARPARLREVGGGDGLRRLPRRHARRRRAHDREGERDRRPARGDRLPHRLPGEGVPDGRGRRVERRHHPRPRARHVRSTLMAAQHHILSVLVENKFGVLSRVAGLFARRGFNIVSLAVSPTEDERFSRMTIVVDADSAPLEQITKQLNKLIPVIKIVELAADQAVERELMLVTVKATRRSAFADHRAGVDLRGEDRRRRPRGDDDPGRRALPTSSTR